MAAGLGDQQNENSGNRGAVRCVGRLRVIRGGHFTGLRLAGRLSIIHLLAVGARGSGHIDQGHNAVGAQDKQRTNDGLATAAAVVIFWPAVFVCGDKHRGTNPVMAD
jgi:hypothetical protein